MMQRGSKESLDEGERAESKRRYTHTNTHTHTHLNHFAIHQKLTQHSKSTILEFIYIYTYVHTHTHTHRHTHTYKKWLSRVWLFATPWAICSSDHGIFQPRVREWVAISFSRVSSWPRDRIRVFCNCRQRFYHLSQQGSPYIKVGTRLEFNFLPLLNK